MSLISLREVYFRWSNQALLNGIQLDIHKGDRIGLLGSNGAGKSTLMNIVLGELQPDKGEIHRSPHLRIAKLEQDVPQEIEGSVETFIASAHPQRSTSATDEEESWRVDHDVAKIISQLDLAGSASIASLSAGLKRRCLLAKALISKPDLLLLDEPTNHLDIDSIEWLEKFFLDYRGTLLFVTHDRSFLRALSTRIVEVDLGRLFDWSCGYDKFLERKKEVMEAEAKAAGRPWLVAKGFDGAAPCGVLKAGGVPPLSARIALTVNGNLRQEGSLDQMLWAPGPLLAKLSALFVLQPGDLIFTGTPAGVGKLEPGDEIRVSVEGLGDLTNRLI